MLFWDRAIITQGEEGCGGESRDEDAYGLVGVKSAYKGELNNVTIGFSGGDDI